MNFPEQNLAEDWHVPICEGKKTLKNVLEEMQPFKLAANDVPFIIKLMENPKYHFGFFPGAVSLLNHDCIHAILGRGVLPKDEAFVIGFTMGSTKKMTRFKSKIFLFVAKYFYPEGYKFEEDEAWVFKMGVIAGSKCMSNLSKVDFRWFNTWSLEHIREKVKIDVDCLKLCYILEKKRFPRSRESDRLICTI